MEIGSASGIQQSFIALEIDHQALADPAESNIS